jgi:hypothetical protein
MKKTLKLIFGAVIVIALLSGFTTYLILSNIPASESYSPINRNATSIIPAISPTNTSINVSEVGSIQFNVSDAEQGGPILGQGKLGYFAKNLGSPNLQIRTQAFDKPNGIQVTIINGIQKNAWYYEDNAWKTYPSSLVDYYNLYQGPIQYYTDAIIANWSSSGNFTYTFEDPAGVYARVTLSDIVINPSLPDSFFQPDG